MHCLQQASRGHCTCSTKATELCSSRSGVPKDSILLGYDAATAGNRIPTFQDTTLNSGI
jgi:hypothetical protein